METLSYILFFSIAGGVLSVLLAALILLFPSKMRSQILPALVSYAAGTLLGAAFLGMIPKALDGASPEHVSIAVLSGVVIFFLLEKLVIWRHCHKQDCDVHNASGPIIIIGDALHNFIDGVVIAGAFLISAETGLAVSIAVIAHEIPQEVGDFALLLDYGYSRSKALLLNVLSSLTTIAGALMAFLSLQVARSLIPYVLAISAASFIYIALADIMPGLQKKHSTKENLIQVMLIALGLATILAFHIKS
ncbi:MAG: ZIP family metal transporter [Spirochaetes bacterium]|jgi:zinc and cadmium transporter|nr:ZIP family metal transporter [Spirochaetota bacterium]